MTAEKQPKLRKVSLISSNNFLIFVQCCYIFNPIWVDVTPVAFCFFNDDSGESKVHKQTGRESKF